jgi:hypothetical protein
MTIGLVVTRPPLLIVAVAATLFPGDNAALGSDAATR